MPSLLALLLALVASTVGATAAVAAPKGRTTTPSPVVAVSPTDGQAGSGTAPGRATWVWDRPDPAALSAFTADRGVTHLYVHTAPVVDAADLAWLTSLAGHAAAAGQELWALGGDPAWVTRPADAVAWQRAALATGLFAGSHVDVEPYALPGWSVPRQRTSLVEGHLTLMATLQADSPLPLHADLPFWAHEVSAKKGTWADGVLTRVDGVTAMSYRDSPAGILDVGAPLLERGAALGVPVQLAAETIPLADCPYCTFAEEGAAALAAAVADVDAALVGHPSYAGLAVHHASAWMALHP
ncbi:hypothetical protein [Thalassiella azotivora]